MMKAVFPEQEEKGMNIAGIVAEAKMAGGS